MARRTKQEAEATRKRILGAALDIIYEKGYARSTFVDIADRIKRTKGAIYWHFKNKPDLFLALASELENQIEAKIGRVLYDTRTLSGLKRALCEMILLVASDPQFRKYYTIIFFRMEWTQELRPTKKFFECQDRLMLAWVVDLLSHAHCIGEIPKEKDIKILSRALLEMVNGLIAYCLSCGASSEERFPILEAALDTFFLGMLVPDKGAGA